MLPPDLFFDFVSSGEISDAHEIELSSFPADEAATLEKFQTRQSQAPELFLGAYIPTQTSKRTLIGYACSTLSSSDTLTHISMSSHDPAGSSVCIHALCVSPEYQRRGVALALLKEYIARLEAARTYRHVLLITHINMRELYEKAGFDWIGESPVVHGPKKWYEMRKVMQPDLASSQGIQPTVDNSQPPIPSGIWEALQRSSRNRPDARPLFYFASIDEVVSRNDQNSKRNKYDLICPREGCGSIILKSGIGKLEERQSLELEPTEQIPSLLQPMPPTSEKVQCWLIQPDPMAFENIGFSKPLVQNTEGLRIKMLSCADCDLGPLGWCYEGGVDFWLPCGRVGYRA